MTIKNLKFHMTNDNQTVIDMLRGDVPEDHFLLLALQLGVSVLQEEAATLTKESISQSLGFLTREYRNLRDSQRLELIQREPSEALSQTLPFSAAARKV